MSNAPAENAETRLQQETPQGKTLFEQFMATLKDDRLRDLITRLKCLEHQSRIIGGKAYATATPDISEAEIDRLLGDKGTVSMEDFQEALNEKISELNALAEKYPSNEELKNWISAIDSFMAFLAQRRLFEITNNYKVSHLLEGGQNASGGDISVLTPVVKTKEDQVMRIEKNDAVDILNALMSFINNNPGNQVHNEIKKHRDELKFIATALASQDIPDFYSREVSS